MNKRHIISADDLRDFAFDNHVASALTLSGERKRLIADVTINDDGTAHCEFVVSVGNREIDRSSYLHIAVDAYNGAG